MRVLILVITFLYSACSLLAQQSVVPIMSLDTAFIKTGERTTLNISIEYRVDAGELNIQWPVLRDTIPSHIEILEATKVDTQLVDAKEDPYLFVQRCELQITSFDTGYLPIHPLVFMVNGDSVLSNAVLLSVTEPAINAEEDFMDIKPIETVELSFMDWLRENGVLITVVLLALVIVFAAARILGRQKKKAEMNIKISAPEIIIPAHIIALQQIEELNKDGLWQQGKFKVYHSRLNQILREYLENRYGINAMEETTNQILRSLDRIGLESIQKSKLKSCLVLADLVKFAKERPLAQENETAMFNVREFVQLTAETENDHKA